MDACDEYDDINDLNEELLQEIELDLRTKQMIDDIQKNAKQNDKQFCEYLGIGTKDNFQTRSMKEKRQSQDKEREGGGGLSLFDMEEGITDGGGGGSIEMQTRLKSDGSDTTGDDNDNAPLVSTTKNKT
eukprot:CAMPEP_0114378724 /NCGR_PEP_ID=MMETSP0102-20121206/1809_1 /TAXON_ID=38822 ORGANISM="Pteridomonas danica, Strain PT" /NCGR_SAMPLE_ID=MMETSP0102 /ASSEMBLY_ACC=CAM_ASM_000212 /LENGTH=128 /DNA_ID=CAMNT_0001533639 /DNA_START=1084 /DNA_END=1466 /DNA_ORIENTATION=+